MSQLKSTFYYVFMNCCISVPRDPAMKFKKSRFVNNMKLIEDKYSYQLWQTLFNVLCHLRIFIFINSLLHACMHAVFCVLNHGNGNGNIYYNRLWNQKTIYITWLKKYFTCLELLFKNNERIVHGWICSQRAQRLPLNYT